MKILASIFDPDENAEKDGEKNSGVNKVITLAEVEGLQERHFNLRRLLEATKLEECSFVVAADLKLINLILGISSHGGKFSCPYCEGEAGLVAGELKSFSSLAFHLETSGLLAAR